MKKILLTLILLFSTIFFIDNVEAKSYTVNTDLFGDIVIDINSINQQFSLDQKEDAFIVTKNSSGTNVVLLTFSGDGSNQNNLCSALGYTGSAIRYSCRMVTFLYDNTNSSWTYFSDSSTIYITNGNFYYMTFKYLNPISESGWTVDYSKYYLLQNGYLNLYEGEYTDSPIPAISIRKSNETTVTIGNETYISSVTLYTEFSNIDNDKYFYLYKYGSSAEWSQIILEQSSSFTRTFNTNDTFYVQVLDKATNETVSSATYTIDNINYNFKPYIDIIETIPTTCTFYKNGQNYTICKNLNIVAKNLEDGNFIASYSYDAVNWSNFENTNLLLNENTTIYFRITNYLTNEISYTSTYTISSIDDDISELGVFNTYSSIYDKDTSFITAYINIYNLIEPVQDNYKIYYSTNSTTFTDITLLLNDMTNYYQYEINNINENITLYFKITDLNDNILYTSTYTINYQIQATENSNFFTNFRTNFHGLSDIISTPLYAIKKINTGVCSSLEIPIPYTNKNISLPCMTTVYENNMPEILNIWQIVTNGLISYYIILDLFRIVKSFKEPEEDKIEVVDL